MNSVPQGIGMNILLVDDSKTQRRIQKNILIEHNIAEDVIFEAGNGIEALEVLDKTDIQLIVLDWNMPELNGLDFVKKIRAQAKWAEVPVMMVTSEAEKRYLLAAIEAGVTNYVAKPITGDVFWDKISQYIK